jgi:hypothetical protein
MPTYSLWRTEKKCFSCQTILSEWEVYYSDGRCPRCGVKHEDAGTIVETVDVAYRLRWDLPAWMFWKKPVKEYKA